MMASIKSESVTRMENIHRLLAHTSSSPGAHDALELAMATASSSVVSDMDDSALVWLVIIGVPAAGKTAIVAALKDVPGILYLDTLTENAFASGYVNEATKDKPIALLQQIEDEEIVCLAIKDLTTLFSLRDDKVKKTLGELQTIYDGEFTKATGTVGVVSYTTRFTMLCCVTPAALEQHHTYMSRIGTRFLLFRVPTLSDHEREHGFDLSWESRSQGHQQGTAASDLRTRPRSARDSGGSGRRDVRATRYA
jgi:hypothetical protein